MQERKELLLRLVKMERPIGPVLAQLAQYGWDCDKELVEISGSDIEAALRAYSEGSVSQEEIEAWANAIECRDDIAMKENVREVLHVLANPLITESLSPKLAVKLIAKVKQ